MNQSFLSIGEAAAFLGVSITSLRRWEKMGSLCSDYRTPGGHRRYSIANLREFLPKERRLSVGYARVSGHDQKKDLGRQEETLRRHLSEISQNFRIISDLGSGLNYRKKGLRCLIALIVSGHVERLVLTIVTVFSAKLYGRRSQRNRKNSAA
jgi:predicted site-specific integrase-resolvase